MRIYTRSGDHGTTGIHGGERVEKDDVRIEANGALDELNAVVGLLRVKLGVGHEWQGMLKIDRLNGGMRHPSTYFVLPGGTEVAALCHLARTVARRAERRLWTLNREDEVPGVILRFVNRLSDLLFTMARGEMDKQGTEEERWQEFLYKKRK